MSTSLPRMRRKKPFGFASSSVRYSHLSLPPPLSSAITNPPLPSRRTTNSMLVRNTSIFATTSFAGSPKREQFSSSTARPMIWSWTHSPKRCLQPRSSISQTRSDSARFEGECWNNKSERLPSGSAATSFLLFASVYHSIDLDLFLIYAARPEPHARAFPLAQYFPLISVPVSITPKLVTDMLIFSFILRCSLSSTSDASPHFCARLR